MLACFKNPYLCSEQDELQTRQREAAGAASSSRQVFILEPLVPDEVTEPEQVRALLWHTQR